MADQTAVLAQIQTLLNGITTAQNNISQTINNMTAANTQYAQSINNSAEATNTLNSTISNTANSVKSFTDSININTLDRFTQSLDSIKGGDYSSLNDLVKVGGMIAGAMTSAEGALGMFSDKAIIGATSSSTLTSEMNSLATAVKSIPGIGGVLGAVADVASSFIQSSEYTKQFENNLVSLQARYGGFRDSLGRLDFIEHLDANMTQFIKTQNAVGTALNLSSSEVSNFAMELSKIPGAYQSIVSAGEEFGGNQMLLSAAMRVARGTTGDQKDALEALRFQYETFGKTNEGALDMLSRTYAASQQLGVGFNDLEKPIQDISKQFGVFGDNTSASVNLVSNLGKSLKDVGLGIGPTMDIIKGVTDSMSRLGTAQKAFMSQQTGGAGGLQGAFQIDLLMSQGKMDEVFDKMKSSLTQQFGGNIVGLQDAASSDTAAAQMQKQVAFLMQGPFGQIVQSQAQAYKLLEAFSTGRSATEDTTKESMSEAFNADKAIQSRQQDSLIAVSNDTKQLVQLTQINNGLLARSMTGGNGEGARALLNSMQSEAQNRAVSINTGGDQFTSVSDSLVSEVQRSWESMTGLGEEMAKDAAQQMQVNKTQRSIASQENPRNVINTPTGPVSYTQTPGGPVNSFNMNKIEFAPLEVRVILEDQDGATISEQIQRATISKGTVGSVSSTSNRMRK